MNLESPDFTDTLNQNAMQNVPINNRRWSSLAMSTPGVVSDSNGYGLVSIRGVSPILNNVEIDGADDNQAFFAEERGRTREAYSTSGNAVREFAVNTGVYSAEYGRAAGGVITSVTKSGTNTIHGQAYFYDRESNWNAFNDYTTVSTLNTATGLYSSQHIKPEDLRKIYGFTAGGALIKDKLFWIYTYDQHTHVFPEVGIPYNPANFYTLPAAALPSGSTCFLTGSATPPAQPYQNGWLSGDTASTKTEDSEACTLAARQGITYAQASADWATLINGGTLHNGLSDLGLNSDLGQVARFGFQEINTPKLDWQITPKCIGASSITACAGIPPAASRPRLPSTTLATLTAPTSSSSITASPSSPALSPTTSAMKFSTSMAANLMMKDSSLHALHACRRKQQER